jgi:hypothetical protein
MEEWMCASLKPENFVGFFLDSVGGVWKFQLQK